MTKYHLIIAGFDEIVSNKYMSQVEKAMQEGVITSYSVIDLEIGKKEVEERLKNVKVKPTAVYYLNDPVIKNIAADPDEFGPIMLNEQKVHGRIRVYIATELRAHEGYLRFCVENNIDALVEKPVLAPFTGDKYEPERITSIMESLNNKINETGSQQSVMTLGRYHKIYNTVVIDELKKRVLAYEAPVTSFHFRHAGGVWNTHDEYNSRNDHPYKFGYGMIMHGGYHYIDLSMQFLYLNKLIYPNDTFSLLISSYAAFPKDQNDRISKKYSALFDDNKPNWRDENTKVYGETDITSTIALINETTKRTITVGTLSFEQTTPSIRTWKIIPEGLYNKNGRTSSVIVEAQLSTLYSVVAHVYDVPVKEGKHVDRIDAYAQITTRANASFLPNEQYVTVNEYDGLFHSDSNRDLMYNWLVGNETKSIFSTHLPSMRMIQALSESVHKQGTTIKIENF